jgi:hypothetical protein
MTFEDCHHCLAYASSGHEHLLCFARSMADDLTLLAMGKSLKRVLCLRSMAGVVRTLPLSSLGRRVHSPFDCAPKKILRASDQIL